MSERARARMSSKGQLVLPKILRDEQGWIEGTELEIEPVPGGVMLRMLPSVPEASLDDLLGCAGYRGPRRSLSEMDAAIQKGAQEKR